MGFLLLTACAERKPLITPEASLQNPLVGTELAPESNYEKGYRDYMAGNMDRARQRFRKSIAQKRDYFPAYLAIGYSYLAEKNPDQADESIRKSLEFFPDYPQAHYALAQVYELRKDYDNALIELNEVQRLNPDYPELQESLNIMKLKATDMHIDLGRRLSASDPEEALRHLKTAFNLAPEITQIAVDISKILVRENRCGEASMYLKIASERLPKDTDIQNQLARCLIELGEYDSAQTIYEDLANRYPQRPDYQQQIREIKRLRFIRSLPEEYHSIPAMSEINRGQLAAYIVTQLKFLERYESSDSLIIVDTLDHWAQPMIQRVVNLGIMDLYPNRTFEPATPVTRIELVRAANRILELLESSGLNPTRREPGPVPDVSEDNIYYGMISMVLSSDVMSVDADGRFHPRRRVSGAEAVSVVNKLQALSEGS